MVRPAHAEFLSLESAEGDADVERMVTGPRERLDATDKAD